MNSEDNPEKSSFIEDAVKYVQIALSPEDVQNLLDDDKVWGKMVTAANLARDEAEAMREGLRKKNHTVTQVKDKHQKEEKHRERFLELYPLVKKDVEEHIAQLQALADKADKLHRDCTISKVVPSSTGVVSGILSKFGNCLAPVTAGVSLALSVTGLGVGAASAVTGVTTSIVESTTMASIESSANNLASKSMNPEKMFNKGLYDHNDPVASSENHLFRKLEYIGRIIRTIKLLVSSPHLSAQDTLHLISETISVQNARELPRALGAKDVSVSSGIRVFSAAAAFLIILELLVSVEQDSISGLWHKMAKTAEKLRLWIQKQEVLEKLKQIYKTLL